MENGKDDIFLSEARIGPKLSRWFSVFCLTGEEYFLKSLKIRAQMLCSKLPSVTKKHTVLILHRSTTAQMSVAWRKLHKMAVSEFVTMIMI